MKIKLVLVLIAGVTVLTLWGMNRSAQASPAPAGLNEAVAQVRVSHLSISTPAFKPFYDDYDYENHGRWLFHLHGPGGNNQRGIYLAPVELPQDAIVTRVTSYFYDGSVEANGYATLVRTNMTGINELMAQVDSNFSDGYVAQTDTGIDFATINNAQYAYFIYWDLPVSTVPDPPAVGDVVGTGVVIEYQW